MPNTGVLRSCDHAAAGGVQTSARAAPLDAVVCRGLPPTYVSSISTVPDSVVVVLGHQLVADQVDMRHAVL